MPATPEQLVEARKLALLDPKNGKRGKSKTTIAKEQRRVIFDQIVSEEFPKLIKIAKAEYKLDQFMGKTPDVIDASDDLKEFIAKLNQVLDGKST